MVSLDNYVFYQVLTTVITAIYIAQFYFLSFIQYYIKDTGASNIII